MSGHDETRPQKFEHYYIDEETVPDALLEFLRCHLKIDGETPKLERLSYGVRIKASLSYDLRIDAGRIYAVEHDMFGQDQESWIHHIEDLKRYWPGNYDTWGDPPRKRDIWARKIRLELGEAMKLLESTMLCRIVRGPEEQQIGWGDEPIEGHVIWHGFGGDPAWKNTQDEFIAPRLPDGITILGRNKWDPTSIDIGSEDLSDADRLVVHHPCYGSNLSANITRKGTYCGSHRAYLRHIEHETLLFKAFEQIVTTTSQRERHWSRVTTLMGLEPNIPGSE